MVTQIFFASLSIIPYLTIAFWQRQSLLPVQLPVLPSDALADIAETAIWEALGITDATYVQDDDDVVPPFTQSPNYTTDVLFRFYNRNEASVGVDILPDAASLLNSSINPKLPTKIFIYGYDGYNHDASSQIIRENSCNVGSHCQHNKRQRVRKRWSERLRRCYQNRYLGYGSYNLIIVDWSSMNKQSYVSARVHTAGVANQTALLLNGLDQSKLCPAKQQHLIGHSLGAHIAGMAGSAAKTRPGRITGLDPAGPLFELSSRDGRLDITDADLVDVIHTSAALGGLASPLGHVDFYPNGGVVPQTECIPLNGPALWCSICRSLHFYAYTINNATAFVGKKCQTHGIIRGKCPNTTETAVMGEHLKYDSPGMYFLRATLPNGANYQTC